MKQTAERLTFTINEAAKALGVGRNTLYEAVRAGTVPRIRMGRRVMIPKHALLGFMGASQGLAPRARSYEEGVADERGRITDLLIRLLAEVRGP